MVCKHKMSPDAYKDKYIEAAEPIQHVLCNDCWVDLYADAADPAGDAENAGAEVVATPAAPA